MKGHLIYLAGPYSHDDPNVRHQRFKELSKVAAHLMRQGDMVYSPITGTHELAANHSLPTDWEYWNDFCEMMLSRCQELIVVKLPGWEESVGVQGEIEIAKRLEIPILWIEEEAVNSIEAK